MFHDLMHQLIPDPVYCGEESKLSVLVYTLLRTLSETVTLVLADCLFVECMLQVGRVCVFVLLCVQANVFAKP